jgi:glycerate-2-kinase
LIKNRAELARFHGPSSQLALSALEAAVRSVEPGALVRRSVKSGKKALAVKGIEGRTLRVDDFQDIYVVGAGKATRAMADALCKIVKVKDGAINIPYGAKGIVDVGAIETTQASHPVPDASGVRGTKKIVDIVNNAGKDDLVFVLISGGGSALMPLPAKGVSLHDKQDMTSALLASGASIHEMNAVRKHLSAVKGGQLVRRSKCRVVSLVLSDVIGDDLEVIASGPTCPDPSTFADAARITKKYGIKGAAARHIEKGAKGLLPETPKQGDPVFLRVHNFIIGNNAMACKAAASHMRRRGLSVDYLGSSFGGEASEMGRRFAHLSSGMQAGSAIVAGGETTVRLGNKKHGKGGRNQEAALAYAIHAKKGAAVIAAFMGTDGIDGNSDAAGAIISARSAAIAKKIGPRYLAAHDSYHALEKMNSLLFTGLTGTNVNDVTILVVADKDVA